MSIQLSRHTIIPMLGGAIAGHTSAWGHDQFSYDIPPDCTIARRILARLRRPS